jgi:bifunctional diaminopimelate decarboxylase / aspartate kinase
MPLGRFSVAVPRTNSSMESADDIVHGSAPTTACDPWWLEKRVELINLAETQGTPAYVYDMPTLRSRFVALREVLTEVAIVHYAIKANEHPEFIKSAIEAGLNLECVTLPEVEYVMRTCADWPGFSVDKILFTPNFAPLSVYEKALSLGLRVTLDSIYPLQQKPEIFRGASVLVRVDYGLGYAAHHSHVVTSGDASKFGVALADLPWLASISQEYGMTVVGLHAHTGSGILDARQWAQNYRALRNLAITHFPSVRILNLGGGLGIPYRPTDPTLDLSAVNEHLRKEVSESPKTFELWMEPGRYATAPAGVLLASVTHLKVKNQGHTFVGVDAGMNDLLRPALYDAYHHIVNLSRLRLDGVDMMSADIVGPICESGDFLGRDRQLPATTAAGDALVIADAGAYGYCMSSHYNMRNPAQQYFLA